MTTKYREKGVKHFDYKAGHAGKVGKTLWSIRVGTPGDAQHRDF